MATWVSAFAYLYKSKANMNYSSKVQRKILVDQKDESILYIYNVKKSKFLETTWDSINNAFISLYF